MAEERQERQSTQERGRSQRGGFGGRGMPVPIERADDPIGTLKRLWTYMRPEAPLLSVVFLLVLVNAAVMLAGPYLIGFAIDNYIIPADFGGLLRMVLFMIVLYLGGAGSIWLQNYFMIGIAQGTVVRLRRNVFDKLQELPVRYFDTTAHGDIMSRLTNDIENISNTLGNSVTQVFNSSVTTVGTVTMMLILSPSLTAVTMVIIPIMLLVTRAVAARTRKHFGEQQKNLGALNGWIEETVSGQRVIKVYCREDAVVEEFDAANEKLRQSGTKATIFAGLVGPMMNVLNNLSLAIVAGFGGYLAIQGTITVGVIASFVNYTRQFTRPLNELANQFNVLQLAIAGAERCFEVLDQEPEIEDSPEAVELAEVDGAVVLENVSFAYAPDTQVLKNVNLEVEPGQTIALVGPTGAGKTTIVNLLTRFYEINEGRITIDGYDIKDIKRSSLRSLLGIVLQDTYLFAESIRDNIRYGRLDATDEEVEAAAKLSNADSFIRKLPQGYDTVLGEDGGDLSQGQRQMLAIARASLADPAILILDEATSSVDTRTELNIQDAMLNLMEGRTCFVIAHRLSTIRNADNIVVINFGEIVEQGTHEELLRKKGFYYDLYMSQFTRQHAS